MINVDISIVVPSFQQGQFIEDCLKSVLNEKDVSYELIVYDAGSTDGTAKVLEKYRNVADITIEPDLGQAHAINKGLSRAKGEILCYLNSDDIFMPEALKKVVQYFKKNPTVDLLYGNAKYIDENSNYIGDYLTRDWDSLYIYSECYVCQPAAFWRATVADRIGLFDEKIECSMDYDYWLRINGSGMTVKRTMEYLACSRDYSETKTRRRTERVYWDNFSILLRRLGYVPAHWLAGYLNLLRIRRKKYIWRIVPLKGINRARVGKILEVISHVFAKDVHVYRNSDYYIVL